MKAALIDADSIIYALAWQHREQDGQDPEAVSKDMMTGFVDQFIVGILQATEAKIYMGALGTASGESFRNDRYKYAPYKGNRSEPNPWVVKWKDTIKNRLYSHWGFTDCPMLEADDLVALAYHKAKQLGYEPIICSPDKDLRQLPGTHYDYVKIGFADVSPEEAEKHFWTQMLTGDGTDNVAGVPGLGEKKAKPIIEGKEEHMFYEQVVRGAYYKYFGDYFGKIIFNQTFDTLSLMSPRHDYYDSSMEKAVEWKTVD